MHPVHSDSQVHQWLRSLQSASATEAGQIASRIAGHPFTQAKILSAVRKVVGLDFDAQEEMVQVVTLALMEYLGRTCAAAYRDCGCEAIGGWIWTFAYRACLRQRARPAMPTVSDPVAYARSDCSVGTYNRAATILREILSGMPEMMQKVMTLLLDGRSRRDTATACGICENYVSLLRTAGRDAIEKAWHERLPGLFL